MATTTITVPLPEDIKEKLEQLAQDVSRSRDELAAEAISDYVALKTWQAEEIGRAVAKADAGGPFVRHEDAMHYLDALARGETPELPRSSKR